MCARIRERERERERERKERVQSSYQRKVVVPRRLTVRVSFSFLYSSLLSLSFLSSSALLSIRGCLPAIAISASGVHPYAYLRVSMHIHTLGYLSRVVTYGDRYRVPLICHELQRLLHTTLRLVFSPFIFLLTSSSSSVISLPPPFSLPRVSLPSLALFRRGDDLPTPTLDE